MGVKKQESKPILEDGSVFQGYAFGGKKEISGEVVFNTGMVGYPESLTDPSYRGQILVFTFPLIGNYGVPENEKEDNLLRYFESSKIQIQGLMVSDYSEDYSHWSAKKSLSKWMKGRFWSKDQKTLDHRYKDLIFKKNFLTNHKINLTK